MLRKTFTLFAAVVMVVGGAAAQEASEGGPRMVVPEKVIDVGEVPQGKIVDANFKVVNEGDETLKINAVRPTCGCTVAEYDKEIAAGTTGWIRSKLDTRDFSGPISKSILVMTSDPETSAFTLIIKANVHPYVEILPRPLMRFNTLQKEGASEKVVVAAIDDRPDFKIERVETKSSFLEASVRKLSGDELIRGKTDLQYEVTVTVKDEAPVGPLQDDLWIYTNHPKAKSVRAKVFGVVRSVLQVSPSQVQFGPVQASAGPGRHVIIVNNREIDPVEIVSADIDDPAFSAELNTVAEGKRYQVTIKVNPDAKKGTHDATMILKTSDKDFPELKVPVRASIK